MYRVLTLVASIAFLAASCNLTDSLNLTTGSRGVFKSTDNAESFQASNDSLTRKDALSGVSVNDLEFDPQNSEVLYLASNSGIYKTENSGQGWQFILTGMSVLDVSLDPRQSQLVYAAGLSGGSGKIIKSSDGGKNWVDVFTEPTRSNAVTSIASYGSVVLAGLFSGEIIRSFDQGVTWQATQDLKDIVSAVKFVSPSTAYALVRTKGLFKSSDSGNTWLNLTSALTNQSFANPQASVPAASVFHDLALDQKQSGVIYLATEEGLYRSLNDGNSWSIMTLPVRNRALKVSSVAVNPQNSNNVYAGIGFTLFKSLNGALTWETKELRTEQSIRRVLIDPLSSNVVYLGLGERK